MITYVKIDRHTLPKDGQQVKWQTHEDYTEEKWKEGTFSEGDDFFLVGFKKSASDWDSSEDVYRWQVLDA